MYHIKSKMNWFQTCADVLKQKIIKEMKWALVFSVLTDKTADIGETE